MPRKLKVFRTAAGFNDAYVAAPSRKAALAAWGADVDLFARGIAEEVTDPELGEEPLANPGEVVMRSRGGLAEQLKAMGPRKRAAGKAKKAAKPAEERPAKPRGKPPSRAKVEKAAAAIAEARDKHVAALKGLEDKREELDRQIAALKDKQRREIEGLQQRRREAEQTYRDALEAWSG
jgi:hypothetical protein